MAYQSLYRRYRPQRFSEVVGQDHVSRTLQNAVRESRVGHAYLFSGPRGTGKTSTARILAKALNCEAPADGEPCGTCDSCVAVAAGTSLDVHEMDAASNRGIDAIRDLIAKAALGTAGRWKVYILDEAHQLTADATSALLKTLEEPPAHVVFVLATTAPEKVLPTIRSRTQHFEFRLLATDVLADHLRKVAADAGLDVPPEAIDLVARRGKGSARDALSALDQVAAAGAFEEDTAATHELVEAMCDRDAGRALVTVAQAAGGGRDPRSLANELLEHLRHAFLSTMAPRLVAVPDEELGRLTEQARRLGPAGLTRAMDVVGEAVAQMKDAADLRIPLEVALVRLCAPEADASPAALLERVERLERRVAQGPGPAPAAEGPATTAAAAEDGGGAFASSRAALGNARPESPAPPAAPAARRPPPPPPGRKTPPATPKPAPAAGPLPTREELTLAWGDTVLAALPSRPRSRFQGGRFVEVTAAAAVFALPNAIHRDRCQEVRREVEDALAAHFGRPVPLELVVDEPGATVPVKPAGEPTDEAADDQAEAVDVDDLADAPPSVTSGIEQLTEAFPGAELVEE